MKERPILFKGEMVRAILEGRKTQTRRAMKNQPWARPEPTEDGLWQLFAGDEGYDPFACPYGKPGDRLWVKETWKPSVSHHCAMDACDCADVWVDYRAGGDGQYFSDREIPDDWLMPKAALAGKNVSPLFMPRWASRITLEIIDVRVERLQDIGEADAVNEGAEPVLVPPDGGDSPHRQGFLDLWESINGAESWDANPWVWVVEFQRIDQGGDQ